VCVRTEPAEIQADITISSSINIAGILLEVSEHSGIWKFDKEIVKITLNTFRYLSTADFV
jgi:hypothetical protein